MSLTEILEEVAKLSPDERDKVAKALATSNDHGSNQEGDLRSRQRELNERLVAEGLLRGLPTRDLGPRKFNPVKIKGKPLSETIIEERR